MTVKRQGRQSAEAARQTKADILHTATELFCEQGFNNVSLRSIGDKAGISHSLIRHHFGNKMNIWQRISDAIHAHFHMTIAQLIQAQDTSVPANQRLFNLLTTMMASLFVDQRPISLLSNIMSEEGELLEHFYGEDQEFSQDYLDLVEQCHEHGYGLDFTAQQFKWIIASAAFSAARLKPLLLKSFEYKHDYDQCLKNNWLMNARMLAAVLSVPENKVPDVEELFANLTPFTCQLTELFAQEQ